MPMSLMQTLSSTISKEARISLMTYEQIREDFELLDDWEDRYRYIIELGRKLPELPSELRTDENKVRGCASQVWLATEVENGESGKVLRFRGDSDAHIVRGLIAILFAIFQEKPAHEILETQAGEAFETLGLKDHLTPQRSNGLASMVARIQADAERFKDNAN